MAAAPITSALGQSQATKEAQLGFELLTRKRVVRPAQRTMRPGSRTLTATRCESLDRALGNGAGKRVEQYIGVEGLADPGNRPQGQRALAG